MTPENHGQSGNHFASSQAMASAAGMPATPSSRPLSLNQAVEFLVETVQQVSLARDLDAVMAIVQVAARQLAEADGATFILRDGDGCFYASEDAIGPLWKGQRLPASTCVSGWAMSNRTPVCISNVFEDSRIPAEAYRSTFVRSLAIVPIRAHEPIGAIGIYWAQEHTPSTEQLKLLQALADSTGVAMENLRIHQELEEQIQQRTRELEATSEELRSEAQLRRRMEAKVLHLSLTDDLTGLNNRRGFLLRAEQMLKLADRVHTQGWLIYIDIDGLKQVNEIHGYEMGDRLIKAGAKVLRESFRESDILGRIGGDEFIVFATGTTTPSSEIEERLTQNMQHHNLCFPDQPPLSMSTGVVRCDPHAMHTLDDMIHQADAAMYIEKRRKRARLSDRILDHLAD